MRSMNGPSEINISRDLVDGEYIWQEEIDEIRKSVNLKNKMNDLKQMKQF